MQRYLAIEQVRLGSRLAIQCTASDEALATLIPPLILQPLVENAVLHGIARLLDGGTISIHGELQQSTLCVRVRNPIDPGRSPNKRQGFGQMLVQRRLQSQYGTAGQSQLHEAPQEYIADVSVPFE